MEGHRTMAGVWFVVGVLLAEGSWGTKPAITLELVARDSDVPSRHVMVVATPLDAASSDQYPNGFVAGSLVPGSVTLPIASGSWRFQLRGPSEWAPPIEVKNVADHRRLTFGVWSTGDVTGQLHFDPRERVPGDLTLRARFWKAEQSRGCCGKPADGEPEGEVDCAVSAEHTFRCSVPATALDLRLRVEGYASHFAWATSIDPERAVVLPPIEMKAGSSLVGFVTTADGSSLGNDVHLELMPAGTDRVSPRKGLKKLGSMVQPDQAGFFRFEGLSEGVYRLVATKPGFAATTVEGIDVLATREARLIQPVEIGRLGTVWVRLSPPLDPTGEPWLVRVIPAVRERGLNVLELGPTDQVGEIKASQLQPGPYVLQILDRSGSLFHSDLMNVQGLAEQEIVLQLALLEVVGEVRLGERPIAARVEFERGGTITLTANEDGEFAGHVQGEGDYKVRVYSDEQAVERTFRKVRLEAGRGGVATVRLALEDTVLRGRVVYEDGEPVASALVAVRPETIDDAQFSRDLRAGASGEFEFRGLPPGIVYLSAHAYEFASAEMAVVLAPGSDSGGVTLTLVARTTLRGILVSPEGQVVPGVRVEVNPAHSGMSMPWATVDESDAQGRFEVRVPRSAREVDVWVWPVGYSLKLLRLAVNESQEAVIRLDRSGGTLGLSYPEGREGDLLLVRGGTYLSFPALQHWSLRNGGHQAPGGIEVPALEAGPYLACLLEPGSKDYFALLRSDRTAATCERTVIAPHAKVQLVLRR